MFKKLSQVSTRPGVYWFLNQTNQVIYVGKAKNLINRLKSYRLITAQNPKTTVMLNQAVKFKTRSTDSEFEALLLEAELIKTYQPKYNLLLKDDRSRLYLSFTQEVYPRLVFTRQKGDFGPFPSHRQLSAILKILRSIFLYCDRPNQGYPCFYFHLNLCSGACLNQISPTQYQETIKQLKLLFKGKKSLLIRQIKAKLKLAVKAKNYEQAIIFRNQLNHLAVLNQLKLQPDSPLPQLTADRLNEQLLQLRRLIKPFFKLSSNYPLTRIEAYDISNLQGKDPTGSMVVFQNGRPAPDQYRYFKIRSLSTPNDLKMLEEVLSRRVKHQEWGIPNLILIDGGKNQVKIAAKTIPWNIPIIGLAKHPDHLCLPEKSLNLLPKSPATHLLQHLRNESHRFAQKLHRRLRLKNFTL
ncbi:MAG: GIY-YIG nuclease family protein [Candidatus Beckwithbacteria bacterium]